VFEGVAERREEVLAIIGRLLALVLVTAGAVFVFGVALKPAMPQGLPGGANGRLFLQFIIGVALIVGHAVVLYGLERGDLRIAGVDAERWTVLDHVIAPLLPIGVVGASAAVLLAMGAVELAVRPPGDSVGRALDLLPAAMIVSLVDALMFRGLLLGLVDARFGHRVALIVASLVPAAVIAARGHPAGAVLATGCSAALLAAVRLRSGSLPASWLAGVTMLWFPAAVLHAPTAGLPPSAPWDFRWQPTGADWLSGGLFGASGAGLTGLCLLVVSFLLVSGTSPHRRTTRH